MDGDGNGDTGGNDGTSSGSGWDDEDSDGLWGWLSGLADRIESVWEAVVNVPALIVDGLSSFFKEVKDAILSLPSLILEGIKEIFIPDAEYIDTTFTGFVNELKMKFGVDTGFFENLFRGESAVEDVKGNYTIPGVGSFNLTFLDTRFFVQGVTYFRPFIRGFFVLLIALFHVKQLIGFFGYNAGVVQGRSDWITYNNTNTGGHKE